jgi:hypothetical protein
MTSKTKVKEPAPQAEAFDEVSAVPDSISLQDLQVLLQIVDLASSRGAFRGAELTQVGAIFDKLNSFLSFIAAQQKAAQEQNAKEQSAESAQ